VTVFYLIVKALLSGVIIMAVVSLMGILWLWRDTGDSERIAAHAEATFWYVMPSLPMFLALTWMLRHGVGFWLAMLGACLLTVALYGVSVLVAALFGVRL
jgi:hypothetical protein